MEVDERGTKQDNAPGPHVAAEHPVVPRGVELEYGREHALKLHDLHHADRESDLGGQ